jgi:integron integrase
MLNRNLELLDKVRETMRKKNYSHKTEIVYVDWIYRFIFYHNERSPEVIGAQGVSEFLNFLAVRKKVAASTQRLALSAITFLYKYVLNITLDNLDFTHLKSKIRIPLILDQKEIKQILSELNGECYLMTGLLYGSGLRLSECVLLRIRDFNFDSNEINVFYGQTINFRKTILPVFLKSKLRDQMIHVKSVFKNNISNKHFLGASMPDLLKKKDPNASRKLEWQYLFPSNKIKIDSVSGFFNQHHHDVSFLQKEVKKAVLNSGIRKRNISCSSFRHSFAAHLLQDGYDIKMVQKLLGHKNISTTMIYNSMTTHANQRVKSPIDI